MNLICRTSALVTTVILVLVSPGSAQVASSGGESAPTPPTTLSMTVPPATDRLRSVFELKTLGSTNLSLIHISEPTRTY